MGNGRNPFETGNYTNKLSGRDADPTPLNSVDILSGGDGKPSNGNPYRYHQGEGTPGSGGDPYGFGQGLSAARRPAGGFRTDLPVPEPLLSGDRKTAEDRIVRELAQSIISKSPVKRESLDQQTTARPSVLREIGSDAAAIGAGFLTKYGIQRMLTNAPGWGKVAGIGLGLASAGFTRDLVNNGNIGSSSDWLRGSAMFGGSLLLARGLSSVRSNQVLGEATTGIEARSKRALSDATTAGIEARSGGVSGKEWDRLIAISNETKQRLARTEGMTPNEIMYQLFKP